MGQFGRIETLADLPPDAELDTLIRRAIERADAGPSPERAAKPIRPEADVPPELATALAQDAQAHATFTAFPPSCRREYCDLGCRMRSRPITGRKMTILNSTVFCRTKWPPGS